MPTSLAIRVDQLALVYRGEKRGDQPARQRHESRPRRLCCEQDPLSVPPEQVCGRHIRE